MEVPGIPRTLNGKKLEVPIKRIFLGVEPAKAANLDSLANPEALERFVQLARSMREDKKVEMRGRCGSEAGLSSRIGNYPGTAIERKEIEAQKYLFTHYETVLKYSWTSGVATSRFLDGLKRGSSGPGSATGAAG